MSPQAYHPHTITSIDGAECLRSCGTDDGDDERAKGDGSQMITLKENFSNKVEN